MSAAAFRRAPLSVSDGRALLSASEARDDLRATAPGSTEVTAASGIPGQQYQDGHDLAFTTPAVPDGPAAVTLAEVPRPPLQSVGEFLFGLRGLAGKTQEELAKDSGLSVRSISDLERDRVSRPRRRSLELLAAALNLDPVHGKALVAIARWAPGTRRALAEELGVEQGTELSELYQQILAAHANSGARQTAANGTVVAAPVPRQLPAATRHFVGRAGDLAALGELLDEAGRETQGTLVIGVVGGTAGVGKTALVVHWAHQVAGRFPDGQLFLDLHGHTQGHPPREPGEALGSLLRALGVPPRQVPAQPEECAALYRQRLAGTRTLILLDNALNEAQVRPLLPGTSGCLVLVTSRRRLKGLHDAHVVALDVLPEADALTLLRTVTAPAHAAGPDLAEIAGLCGRLPLALRIAGALLRHRPAWTPRYLAGLLRDERRRLTVLADGDNDLRAVFDLSYTALGERQRLLFRRLVLVPGPELDAFAAAALLGADPAAAGLLEDLVDHNLLIEHAPGRYRLHDLIRVHARTLAGSDPEPDHDGALDRLLHYYAYTAQSASALIARYPRPAPDGPAPCHAPALPDPEAARAWLRAEHENLEAAHDRARSLALDGHAVALAAGLAEILRADGPLDRALDLHQAAAAAAERHGWSVACATALTDLASVRVLTGDLAGAADAATQALRIYRATGNRPGEAAALTELARTWILTGDLTGAADAATQALRIYSATGNRPGEAAALTELARIQVLTVDLAGAADAATQALPIYRATGNRLGEADALTELARIQVLTGDLTGAADAATQVLGIYRATGNRLGEASALTELARIQILTGDLTGAADAATQALRIYRATGNRLGEAAALGELARVRLAAGDLPGSGDALSGTLEIYRAMGSRNGEGWALNHYAAVAAATGDLPRALALYEQALAMNRELNKPDDEAIALEGLGECLLSAGDARTGAAHLNQALEIYQRMGMKPDIERVRGRLSLNPPVV
jgi:tetratricopeptide (TPR) repeat protein/transcriptional regulator with XRE-family HTH domain